MLLLLFLLPTAAAWEKYARPIEMAKPNKDGVYEFVFEVTRRMTMQSQRDDGLATPVDYDPHTRQWSKRDRDQLKPCHLSHNISDQDEYMKDVIQFDGRHDRVMAINGESPGPMVAVPYMAEISVRVINRLLTDSITVHFHGIDKRDLWYMDGVAFVQQCPITVSSEFEYRFLADVAGTHWWHGHFATDRGDGLAGGMVVYKDGHTVPKTVRAIRDNRVTAKVGEIERVVPDREYYVMLQDWGRNSIGECWLSLKEKSMKWMYGKDNFEQCWQPTRHSDGSSVGGSSPLSAILVNSKGWHVQEDVRERPHALPLETFRVKKGENVLFRIVNAGVAQELLLHFEGHQMTVVAADGQEVKPYEIDYLVVFVGERYDVLITALDEPKQKTYHLIAETMEYYKWDWSRMETTYGMARIEYEDVHKDEEEKNPDIRHSHCSLERRCTVLNCPFGDFDQTSDAMPFTCVGYEKLQSAHLIEDAEILQDKPFKEGFEEHFINMHYDSHLNGYRFAKPAGMPYYHTQNMSDIAIDCKKSGCPKNASKFDPRCRCFIHYKHKLGNIVQLTVYNMGQGGGFGTGYAHPFHVHGTQFYVMKVGYGSYNGTGHLMSANGDFACESDTADCNDLPWKEESWMKGAVKGMNTLNPSLRDTVTIPAGGYVVIRFRASNPGWWFAHCHITLHAMGGTAYAFQIGDDDEIPIPPADLPHSCGVFRMPKIPHTSTLKSTATSKRAVSSSASIHPFIQTTMFGLILLML